MHFVFNKIIKKFFLFFSLEQKPKHTKFDDEDDDEDDDDEDDNEIPIPDVNFVATKQTYKSINKSMLKYRFYQFFIYIFFI